MKEIHFIGTTPNALMELIDETVKRQLTDLKKHLQPKEPTEYLTRNEVADLLKINLSTVHNWTKNKTLISYSIGARIYYKRKEVENAIIKLNQ